MDNNMSNDNINQQPVMPDNMVQPMPQQPAMPQQPVMPDNMAQPMPQQPVMPDNMAQPMPQQPVMPQNNMAQPINPENPGEIPVINVEQTPTEVFGQQVNNMQPNDPTRMNQMLESINMQQQPEQPKYGYNTNEQKPDLNADSNVNLKVVIFIAILIFAFIMAMPYLSDLLDKH